MNALTTAYGLYRLAAFSRDPQGGNPAGVWVGAELPTASEMLDIAAEVGFSETAFLAALDGNAWQVRFYSPLAEVPFCGHATIASGVHLGRSLGAGSYYFQTAVGSVPIDVQRSEEGWKASLTSIPPRHTAPEAELLYSTLGLLGWREEELDRSLPPALAFAGAWHLVLAVASADTLASLDYDFVGLQQLMIGADLTTLQLIWRENETTFHARNPFPVGGVVEDPATGAAAAALAGYLRDAELVDAPTELLIWQGVAMGRPSRISVHVPASGGIIVSGTAVDLPLLDLPVTNGGEPRRLAYGYHYRTGRASPQTASRSTERADRSTRG